MFIRGPVAQAVPSVPSSSGPSTAIADRAEGTFVPSVPSSSGKSLNVFRELLDHTAAEEWINLLSPHHRGSPSTKETLRKYRRGEIDTFCPLIIGEVPQLHP
jgi:hypothetical protein